MAQRNLIRLLIVLNDQISIAWQRLFHQFPPHEWQSDVIWSTLFISPLLALASEQTRKNAFSARLFSTTKERTLTRTQTVHVSIDCYYS